MAKIKSPTKEQSNIINAVGNIAVLADPGSGKTYVLSELIKKALLELPSHQGVIAISYTNKASDELKRRSLVGGVDKKSSFFGTIDRFCFAEIVASFGKHVFGYPKEELEVIEKDDLSGVFTARYNSLPSLTEYKGLLQEHIEFFCDLFRSGKVLLKSIGILANYVFDNSKACQLYIKARYVNVSIDEYQDSGNEQHLLFLKLANLGLKAVAVGDIKQAIFGFAGKDSKYLISLKEQGFVIMPLLKNHRCHASISNYSKALMSNFLKGYSPEYEETEDIRVLEKNIAGDEEQIADWIDQNIEQFMNELGVIHPREVCILVKSNWKGVYISSLLKTPCRFISSTPLDSEASLWGMVFKRLILYVFDEADSEINVLEDFIDVFANKTHTKRLIKKVKEVRSEILGLENISMLWGKEANVKHISDKFIDVAGSIYPERFQISAIRLLEVVLKKKEFLTAYFPPDDSEIQIMNFHKSKGLEFDLVFHLDLYQYILPKKIKRDGEWKYSNLSEDINLHYVGLTRAREACVLVSSTSRTSLYNSKYHSRQGKQSEFLVAEGLSMLKKMRKII